MPLVAGSAQEEVALVAEAVRQGVGAEHPAKDRVALVGAQAGLDRQRQGVVVELEAEEGVGDERQGGMERLDQEPQAAQGREVVAAGVPRHLVRLAGRRVAGGPDVLERDHVPVEGRAGHAGDVGLPGLAAAPHVFQRTSAHGRATFVVDCGHAHGVPGRVRDRDDRFGAFRDELRDRLRRSSVPSRSSTAARSCVAAGTSLGCDDGRRGIA